jgi:uncharacterized protein (TIGR03437 family)
MSLRLVFLALVPALLAAADDRVVDRVDITRRIAVRGNRHPLAQAANDRGPADLATELSYATVLLRPGAPLEQFLREQQDPGSPNYRRFLTPEEFADRFGLSQSDIGQVAEWLRSEGLQVHDVARGRLWITFSGTAATVGRALRTQFHRYETAGESHIANAADPSVPAALERVVAGFDGLHDFEPAPMHVQRDTALFNAGGFQYLSPDDFSTIYNVKPLYDAGIDGTGLAIAVIGRTSIDLNDVRAFRRRFNLPVNDPRLVLVGPDPGRPSEGDFIEANLDLDWSGAVARNATIHYVYAQNIRTSLQYAIDRNIAPIVTYSYGACELGTNNSLRHLAQQANAQGITFMAASGDWGAATCDRFTALTPQAAKGTTLSYPANVPEVTAVGGTQFDEGTGSYWAAANDANGASALSYIPETVWNEALLLDSLVATGGGPSAFFSKPYWQTGPGVPAENARHVPDVSLNAGAGHVPYLVISGGALRGVGGTSAGSPAFAGVVALLNQYLVKEGAIEKPGLGNINPMLYRLAQTAPDAFHDIVVGDNKVPCVQSSPNCVDGKLGYAAGPGYDMATGLGSIDAHKLVTKWQNGTASTTTLTASPNRVDLNTMVRLTAVVAGGGRVAPTGTVTFLANGLAVGSVPLAQTADGMAASVTVRAALLVAGTSTVTAWYSGDNLYTNSGGTATVELNVTGTGSLVVPFITPNPVTRAGNSWPYTISLTEKAGVATRITGFTVNGANNAANIPSFNNGNIPAKGTVSASLSGSTASIPTTPFDRTFVFTGVDPDGTAWTQQITATFVGPMGPVVVPAITLTSTPASIQAKASDPACMWSQELVLSESGGYLVQLAGLTIAGANLSGQIQPLFGTTRLAPFGVLRAPVCWDSTTIAGSTKTYTITGAAENGQTVSATATVSFQPAAAAPVSLSIGPQSLELTTADNQHDATAAIDVVYRGGAASWKASVTPANATTSWLKISPISGSGNGQIAVRAETAGLSNGVYRAWIAVETPDAVPDHIGIPVVLIVGAGDLKLYAIGNAASFEPVFAPGMLMAVFASGIATLPAQARNLPLPLGLGGVTATVNGVAAPILGTFPGTDQVNLQIPYEAGTGPAVLAVNVGGKIAHRTFTISTAAPGLFGLWDTAGRPVTTLRAGQVAVAYITGEGDITPFLATGDAPLPGTAVARLPRARQPLSVTVGDLPAEVIFHGIPVNLVGVTQINFTVPAGLAAGTYPVVVTVGDGRSQAVMVRVQ